MTYSIEELFTPPGYYNTQTLTSADKVTFVGDNVTFSNSSYETESLNKHASHLAEKSKHVYPNMTTQEIQSILDGHRSVMFTNGTFVLDPIFIKSNSVIYMSPNTILQATSTYGEIDKLLNMYEVNNVVIHGNNGTVKMTRSDYTTGEWRHCVDVRQSHNVHIYNLIAKDSGGDGFTLNGTNISLINCISDNNRRQGLSISNVKNALIIGGEYKNSNGTNPQYGIDIEPDNELQFIQNLKIIGVKTSGNARGGISVVPNNLKNPMSVYISDWVSENDGSEASLLFALSPIQKIEGEVVVTNAQIINPKSNGVKFLNWSDKNVPIKLKNITIIDPGDSENGSPSIQNNGFILDATSQVSDYQGNISIEDCKVIDTRTPKITHLPLFFQSKFMPIKNVDITHLEFNGWVSNYTTPSLFGNSFTAENIKVKYKNEYKLKPTTTLTMTREQYGVTVTNENNASHTTNLPLANDNIGMIVRHRIVASGGFMRIIPNSDDTILRYGGASGVSVTGRRIGDYIKLISLGNKEWQVVEINGEWYSHAGTLPIGRDRVSIGYYSVKPVSGAWTNGEYAPKSAYNEVGTSGSRYIVKGWLRLTTGSLQGIGVDWMEDRAYTGN